MKSKFVNFIKKYWLCFVASTLPVIGLLIIKYYFDNVIVLRTDMFQWSVFDFYLLYGLPLYATLYGILTRAFTKKIWAPNIILFMTVWLLLFAFAGLRFDLLFTVYALAWPAVMVVISLLFTLLTSLLIKIGSWFINHMCRAHE